MTESDHVEGAVATRAPLRQRGQNRAPEGAGTAAVSDVGKEIHAATLPFRLCADNTFSVIYQAGNESDDRRMDATEARTHHIRRLVAEAGGPAEFSRQTRWSQAQVSQWISEANPKGIGRQLAREIEQALGLPEASMDRPAGVSMASQSERFEPAKVVRVFKALTVFLKRRDPSAVIDLAVLSDAELFCGVYEEFAIHADAPEGDMFLGAAVADLVAKREAVGHGRRSGGRNAAGGDDGEEAGEALPSPKAAVKSRDGKARSA